MATPRPTVMICATCKKGLTRRYIYCAGNCASVISLWTCGCPRVIPSRCQLCLSSRLAELHERTFATIADDHGEQPMRGCTTCFGTGTVTYSLMRLTEADRWVRTNFPEWDGDNRSHNGVTLFSMAEWFRRRRGFAAETVEAGLIDDDVVLRVGGADVIKPGDTVLHRRVIEFTGFAWGYGGEGPHGLAALLADAFSDDFPTFDLAFAFVVRQPFGAGWMFRAGDGRNGDVLRKQEQDLGESGLHGS